MVHRMQDSVRIALICGLGLVWVHLLARGLLWLVGPSPDATDAPDDDAPSDPYAW